MSTAAEPTVAERLSAFDKVRAETQRFADKIKHKNREYRRTRAMAALMVAEAVGANYSDEKLRKSGCPYLSVDGTPLYRDQDLRALAESILDRALKRGDAAARSAPSALVEEIIDSSPKRRARSSSPNCEVV
jgi:hypothetical protein